jgi:hypothetical protein
MSTPLVFFISTTREEMSERGKRGAEVHHSRYPDARALTAAAREAFNRRFVAAVDPDGVLPTEERERRVRECAAGN